MSPFDYYLKTKYRYRQMKPVTLFNKCGKKDLKKKEEEDRMVEAVEE